MKKVRNVNNVSWGEIPDSPALPGNTLWVTAAKMYCSSRLAWSEMTYFWWMVTTQDTSIHCTNTAFISYNMGRHRTPAHGRVLQAAGKCNQLLNNTEQIASEVLNKLVACWWRPDSLPDHLVWMENTSNNQHLFTIFGGSNKQAAALNAAGILVSAGKTSCQSLKASFSSDSWTCYFNTCGFLFFFFVWQRRLLAKEVEQFVPKMI